MKAITANALNDGRVIYLGKNNQWCDYLKDAKIFADEDAETALVIANQRVREIAGAYLINITQDNLAAGREALHETIRSQGPTIRRDLGKQAQQPAGDLS